MTKVSLVFGVGINDVGYVVKRMRKFQNVQQQEWVCPFYKTWKDMLRRCYSGRSKAVSESYGACSVSESWLKLSKFRSWMEARDWDGKALDKDLLIRGNKMYSEETCCFLTKTANTFLTSRSRFRGKHPIGAHFITGKGFFSQCSNPFTNKNDYLGVFDNPIEAHLAWKTKKHEHACRLAEMETDDRIKHALRTRYAPETDWITA